MGSVSASQDSQVLRRLDRGRVDVKRALPDGRRKIVMTGVELLEKLVPLNT
jgi:hypothetical protein